jgi:hypothetical protein
MQFSTLLSDISISVSLCSRDEATIPYKPQVEIQFYMLNFMFLESRGVNKRERTE